MRDYGVMELSQEAQFICHFPTRQHLGYYYAPLLGTLAYFHPPIQQTVCIYLVCEPQENTTRKKNRKLTFTPYLILNYFTK